MKPVYTIDEIKTRVAPIARQYELSHAWLFGSYARGEATPDSDVDICIEKQGPFGFFGFPGLYADLQDSLEKAIDIVTKDGIKSNTQFKENIEKEEILIYG
jgi:predicted nucleotidyltransferase